MGQRASEFDGAALDDLHRQLVDWRNTGRKGGRIPEELWARAAGLARVLGVHRVARTLGLSYESLKQRAAVEVETEARGVAEAASAPFVELALGGFQCPECVIELQGPRGKLTIRLAGHSPEDVATVAKALWRTER